MAYLEEVLMRQAVAAREQQAASALLARLREREIAFSEKRREKSPITGQASDERMIDEAVNETERDSGKLADLAFSEVRSAEEPELEKIQHSNSPVPRLLRELTALTGEQRFFAVPEMGEEAVSGDNWLRMEQRLRRAVASTAMPPVQRGERLASEGPRSMEPYGQADAAALSRLYERDARRYDGGFEWGR